MRRICRVLFSRYAISAVMIVLEVALMVYLFLSASNSIYAVIAVSSLATAAAFISVINRNANPEYKVSWISIILILPPFGAIIYLLFYQRRMSKRETRLLRGVISEMKGHGVADGDYKALCAGSPLAAGKARAIMSDDVMAEVYRGTSSRFFSSGEEYFDSLIDDLESAERYIFLEYFIIDAGELWDKIHFILKEKAAAGLDVRLLYDDIGCMKTLPSHYELLLRHEKIKTYRFARVNPRVSSVHHNRDHRKICVIDGAVGYTGGVNIGDEYINKKSRFGYWKDGGIRLEGDAVCGLLKLFLGSWDFTSKTISDYEELISTVSSAEASDGGFYIPFGSGPSPIYKRPVGKNVFLNIINQAERYVYITTPYLIIDYDLTESLRNAALRGVDVRIVTPGVADKKKVKIMTKSAYPHLMEAGVKIYEYTPGFIHEKTLVCDDEYAVVGTINFDYRSLVHHFENAVWIYKSETVLTAKAEFLATLEVSMQADAALSRLTFLEWVVRNGIRLFAPLL